MFGASVAREFSPAMGSVTRPDAGPTSDLLHMQRHPKQTGKRNKMLLYRLKSELHGSQVVFATGCWCAISSFLLSWGWWMLRRLLVCQSRLTVFAYNITFSCMILCSASHFFVVDQDPAHTWADNSLSHGLSTVTRILQGLSYWSSVKSFIGCYAAALSLRVRSSQYAQFGMIECLNHHQKSRNCLVWTREMDPPKINTVYIVGELADVIASSAISHFHCVCICLELYSWRLLYHAESSIILKMNSASSCS